MSSSILRYCTALILLIMLCACEQQELASNIDAKQSVEMLVVLSRAGIRAEREKLYGNTQSYKVIVSPDDYMKSLEVIHEYGLPRNTDAVIDVLTKQQALAPQSPALMSLRSDMAQAMQLENLLLALPGVVDAKVVIRSGTGINVFSNEESTPTRATVLIRYALKSDEQSFSFDEAKRIILQAVSGLEEANLNITFAKVNDSIGLISSSLNSSEMRLISIPPFRFKVPIEQARLAKRQLLGAAIMIVILGGILGVILNSASRKLSKLYEEPTKSPMLEPGVVIEPNAKKLFSRKPTLMISGGNITGDSQKGAKK